MSSKDNNPVSNPAHYTQGKYEAIKIINDFLANSNLKPDEAYLVGNVLKYLLRFPHKGKLMDLQKARVYLGWLIEGIE